MRQLAGRRFVLASVIGVGSVALAFVYLANDQPAVVSAAHLRTNPVDAARAMSYLRRVCDVGPRPSGSDGMLAQQELARAHFEKLGAVVRLQPFDVRHPLTGERVAMANLIASWAPEKKERILLCAHYDTRPFPDRDPVDPRGVFIGANDGASGVALLMELAHHAEHFEGKYGVDMVLFDGEEFVFSENDEYLLGSAHFAREYLRGETRYRSAVLVDMIGDADLVIPKDWYSVNWSDTRPLVNEVWRAARRLRVREFVRTIGPVVRDDHVSLHDVGGIRAIDLIDFDYAYWHTREDTPDKCSGESLAKVGWVLLEWLQDVQGAR